ncbi:hypothetical protein EV189_1435 [Motilibacter rhizosphaerae]|uniref:Pirin N-terminal domain-containing protein n=1 Tax=Motilibacter rhizosphaerae TaxID=598652 RepID=A0A4Q7NRW9_9ACTN|nr:pirin family protein [Motilibacter rhizosphaerae]RZS89664.1 hypothetical protein EV189_1435 [Motilibacter rhizosphaerae]
MSELCRAGQRYRTEQPGITSLHAFSFGAHYDPANVAFGPLIALNEEDLLPGSGFAPHPHAGVEIVTLVLSGTLHHRHGHSGVMVPAGHLQRLDAVGGVTHSEAAGEEPLRFLQSWLVPQPDDEPVGEYAVAAVPEGRGWATAAGDGGLPLRTRGARLLVGRFAAGEPVPLPPVCLLLVVSGALQLAGDELTSGDSLRRHESSAGEAQSAGAHLVAWVFG